MNKKFVKVVAIILAAIMILSVAYVLFAVVAGTLASAASITVTTSVVEAAVPLLAAA